MSLHSSATCRRQSGPPLADVPEWGQEDWRANKLLVFEVPAFYERSMENGLDPSHNEFVHPAQGSPNMRKDLIRKPLEMEDVPWGSKFLMRFDNQETGTEALADPSTVTPPEVTAGSGFVGT